jgi:hypothetical protein
MPQPVVRPISNSHAMSATNVVLVQSSTQVDPDPRTVTAVPVALKLRRV